MKPVTLAAPLFALLLALPALAAAPVAAVDPAHTSAHFSVKHLTLTTVSGTIGVKDVTLVLGETGELREADATFDLKTIDTQESDRDNDLRSAHWFDVATYPLMTFKSTKIVAGSDGTLTIDGDLTFHGVTKPVILAAKFEGSVKDAKGHTHIGYSATTSFDRTDWNLGSGYPAAIVGHQVSVNLELEAIEG